MVFKLINYPNINFYYPNTNFYYPNTKGKEGVTGGGGEGRKKREKKLIGRRRELQKKKKKKETNIVSSETEFLEIQDIDLPKFTPSPMVIKSPQGEPNPEKVGNVLI